MFLLIIVVAAVGVLKTVFGISTLNNWRKTRFNELFESSKRKCTVTPLSSIAAKHKTRFFSFMRLFSTHKQSGYVFAATLNATEYLPH
jgi:hypothetical protein